MGTHTEATVTTTRPIGINTTYIINGNNGTATRTSETFDASRSDAFEERVGLPIGDEPVKSQPGDDTYSGMHDQGPLLPLKEGGPIAFLIGCVGLAKDHNDNFLTKRIEEEKTNKQKNKEQRPQQQERNQSESPDTVAKESSAFPNKRPRQ